MKKFKLRKTSLLLLSLAILLAVAVVATVTKKDEYKISQNHFGKALPFDENFGSGLLESKFYSLPEDSREAKSIRVGEKLLQAYYSGHHNATTLDGRALDMEVYFDLDQAVRYHFGQEEAFAVVAHKEDTYLASVGKVTEVELVRVAHAYYTLYNEVFGGLNQYQPLFTTVVWSKQASNGSGQEYKEGYFGAEDGYEVVEYTLDFVQIVDGVYTEPYAEFIFDGDGNLRAYLQAAEYDWESVYINQAKLDRSLKKYVQLQKNGSYYVESYEVTDKVLNDEGNLELQIEVIWRKSIFVPIRLSDTMFVTVILD